MFLSEWSCNDRSARILTNADVSALTAYRDGSSAPLRYHRSARVDRRGSTAAGSMALIDRSPDPG